MSVLPTLGAAREAGLPLLPHEPEASRKLVALLVIARLLRRETWQEDRLLQPPEVARLRRESPPPARDGGFSSWMVSSAEGGKTRLEHVTDRVVVFRDVFIHGDLAGDCRLFGVESAVESLVPNVPPDEYECKDLRFVEHSAYRGQRAAVTPPTFRGHEFGDTIMQGKDAVEALFRGRGRVIECHARAFAWPLLWLRWSTLEADVTEQAIILADEHGGLHAITGSELARRDEERNG